jgi:hypothetical protein
MKKCKFKKKTRDKMELGSYEYFNIQVYKWGSLQLLGRAEKT